MRVLQRISIKNFLMGVVGLLVVILAALSLNNVINTYSDRREVSRVDKANELSDYLLEVAGYEAKERGITSMALSSDAPADSSIIQKIQEVRAKGDDAFKKSDGHARGLMEADSANTLFKAAVGKANDAHAELEAARKTVDSNLSLAQKNLSPKDWVKLITSVIDTTAEMRLAAFASNASRETLQGALSMNIELKQAIWLVSEYAGRERATIAPFVNSRKPFDQAAVERLNTLRAVVDINLKPILRLKETNGIDPEVLKAADEMEKVFLGKFGETRKAVYAAGATGNYPINGKEWIEKCSEGIDSVLALSAAVGKMVDERVASDMNRSKWSMAASAVVLVLVLFLGITSLAVIKTKVVSPMLYLNDTMANIEKTGDLTLSLDVKSRDESGQMANTFNNMIGKFRDIIREIHSSTETLSSASEELSASAVQIAGGSQSQSARASQVSTAAQEMSATIIEVAKNVAGAADAAKEASTVAMKGGEIVSETIESMNGIAETAKESSGIIATLGGRSQEIGKIINVIEDIADQTNLLALNAAIEAARAGEQGRGFAVVADEVRKLAEKTMKATKEIGDMIKAMQDETARAIHSMDKEVHVVESGVRLATDAGRALKEIVSKVDVVTSMVHQITTASEQQSAATEQISDDIESVANLITETSSSAQQIAKASQEIAELASGLKGTVEVFKVSGLAEVRQFKKERPDNVVNIERQSVAV